MAISSRSIQPDTTQPRSRSYGTWATSVLAILVAGLVYRSYLQDQALSGSWGCEMSWMTPSYIRISRPKAPPTKYDLYLYREHDWDVLDKPTGHPVIFVPGNAGSYKQVRSVASSAARQLYDHPGVRAEGMEGAKNLDFFAVDFNEDFSAFHAATLREQALFLSKATTRVLSEYNHLPIDDRPRKATLLAHSMGGIVARLALTLGENDLIDVILTMSTPHLLPPSTLEYEMEVIYESISRAYNESSPLLFSICGGVSDSQIVSDACALSRDLISEKDGFAVFSSGIPGVWTGVDHQAMVWCHQVRWRVAKILLEMTGVTGRRDKLAVAEKWLLHRTRSLSPPSDLNRILEIQVKSENMTILLWPSGSGTLQEDPPIRLQWCDVDGSCRDVNGKVQPFPRPSDEMAPFPLVGEGIKQNEVAFAVSTELPAPRGSLVVYGQELESSGGPHLMESVRGNSWSSQPSMASPVHRTVDFSELSISSLSVHRLDVTTADCTGRRPIIRHISRQVESLQGRTFESRYIPVSSSPIFLHSHVGHAPFLPSQRDSLGIEIEVFQDPECPITHLRLSLDLWASLGKILIRYRMTALSWPLGWTALVVLNQVTTLDQTGKYPSFQEAVEKVSRWPLAYAIVALSSSALVQAVLAPRLSIEGLLLGTTRLSSSPLIAAMALWTFGVMAIASLMITLLAFWSKRVFQVSRFVRQQLYARHAHRALRNSDTSSKTYTIIASTVIVTLLVRFCIPRQMAFVILFLIQWTKMLLADEKSPHVKMLFSVFILMFFLLPFNVVILAVWGRNLWANWRQPFSGDHDILPLLPILGLVQLGWAGYQPINRTIFVRAARLSLTAFALVAFMFGSRWTFVLPWVANLVFLSFLGILWP